MALPVGQISMSQVNTELGIPSTTEISLNQANVRSLAAVPSGAISMSNLQGKSNAFATTISSPQSQMDLFTYAVAQGYSPAGGSATITIAPGVYIWSDSTSVAAMTIPSGFGPGNLTLVNNGYIMGRGGNGGAPLQNGNPGGPAISMSQPVTINNTNASAYIGGGGGGGGNGSGPTPVYGGGGGGAGGGGGGAGPSASPAVSGGSIGNAGTSGANGTGGGGGGRVFPGTVSPTSPGTGNPGGGNGGNALLVNPRTGVFTVGAGAGGAGWGATGGTGGYQLGLPSGSYFGIGGAANSVGGNNRRPANTSPRPGGTGGKAVSLNANTVTWVSGDTTRVYGSVS